MKASERCDSRWEQLPSMPIIRCGRKQGHPGWHHSTPDMRQWATTNVVECPVCAPVTYSKCAGCFGRGWVTPRDAALIRVALRH